MGAAMASKPVQRPRDAFGRAGHVLGIGVLLWGVYLLGILGAGKCPTIIERLSEYPWFLP